MTWWMVLGAALAQVPPFDVTEIGLGGRGFSVSTRLDQATCVAWGQEITAVEVDPTGLLWPSGQQRVPASDYAVQLSWIDADGTRGRTYLPIDRGPGGQLQGDLSWAYRWLFPRCAIARMPIATWDTLADDLSPSGRRAICAIAAEQVAWEGSRTPLLKDAPDPYLRAVRRCPRSAATLRAYRALLDDWTTAPGYRRALPPG